METTNTQPPQVPQAQPAGDPGFIMILKASLQLFTQNWLKFVKLTLALLVPLLILGAILFFAFGMFQSKALGAPSLPGQNLAVETPPVTDVQNTVPDTIVPETTPPDSAAPDTTVPDTAAPVGTAEPETAPAGDVAPAAVGTEVPLPEATDSVKTGGSAAFFDNPQGGTVPIVGGQLDTGFTVVNTNGGGAGSSLGLVLSLVSGVFLGLFALIYLPLLLYMLIYIVAHIRLVVLISQGQEMQTWDIIKWAFKKMGSFIMLYIRLFIYAYWPILFVLIAYTTATFVASAIDSGSTAIPSSIFTYINYILGLIGVLAIPFMFYRIPRASFAKYVLAENECTSKEALRGSIAASKGNWWKIVSYSFGLGFVVGIPAEIIMYIFTKIQPTAGAIITMVISVAIGYVGMIFYFGLYHLCKMLNEGK